MGVGQTWCIRGPASDKPNKLSEVVGACDIFYSDPPSVWVGTLMEKLRLEEGIVDPAWRLQCPLVKATPSFTFIWGVAAKDDLPSFHFKEYNQVLVLPQRSLSLFRSMYVQSTYPNGNRVLPLIQGIIALC